MNRRTLLKRFAAIPLLPILWPRLLAEAQAPVSTAKPVTRAGTRRVRPSDPEWPNAASWEKLNQQVGGQLIKVQSPVSECKSAPGSPACQDVLKTFQNPYFIGDQPGATQTTGWVDGWMSAPSVYAVRASNSADVAAAINFARENNLRLVVKGGGHSYQGTSNAADSLTIWTRGMNSIVMHDAFVPEGCAGAQPPQPAATIEAGAMWIDAYNAVTTIGGRYVQGGGCATVGVAGLIQSGGFGSFSKNYGMAAAGLLQAEIVTADGTVRIANACTNPELFWALKGGGGGSFGVVTKVTLRTRELPEFFGRVHMTIKANTDSAFHRLIGLFISFYQQKLFNSHWGESVALTPDNTLSTSLSFQGLDPSRVHEIWQPILDAIAQSHGDFTLAIPASFDAIPARNYWDAVYRERNLPNTILIDQRKGSPASHVWWTGNQSEVGIFVHGYESAWLPASLLKNDHQARLVDALFASTRNYEVDLHFNKGLAGAPPDAIAAARDTAINPAVLDAFALAIIAGGSPPVYPGVPGHEPDLDTARRNAAAIKRGMDELRKIVPNAGSYVSEGNFFDRAWQKSFWGENYPRLKEVKAKYDPDGLFFVHHGVGSEDWSDDGFARLTAGR
jgi:FAD/FMN-containing dehydrogenase